MTDALKPLQWVGSAKKDLLAMPDDVQDVFGFALHLAQAGKKHDQAKPLKGFGGAGVLEVVEDHMGDTFRAVYTVKLANRVYVLHCFQKKSTRGIETPKPDIDLIRERLKAAQAHAKGA
jgi:phage-related protein